MFYYLRIDFFFGSFFDFSGLAAGSNIIVFTSSMITLFFVDSVDLNRWCWQVGLKSDDIAESFSVTSDPYFPNFVTFKSSCWQQSFFKASSTELPSRFHSFTWK